MGKNSLRLNIIRTSIHLTLLSTQIAESQSKESEFWGDATKYASVAIDEPFVDEVAYMMVSLHQTGA